MKKVPLVLGLALGALAGGAAGFLLPPLLGGLRGGGSTPGGDLEILRREVQSLRSRLEAWPRPAAAAARTPPGPEAAPPPPAAEPGGNEAGVEASSPEALREEIAAMREELESWRSLPGETERLLKTIADPSKSRGEKVEAAFALLEQCDLPAHFREVIAALADEKDVGTRYSLRTALGRMAGKFHCAELHNAVLDDIRKGQNPGGPGEVASHMLAEYHGAEGIDGIRALLDDESGDVRRAAAGALGKLPRSEATVSALRAAESNGDPWVRGLSALQLAALGEDFAYPGLADDWRAGAADAKYYELRPFFEALRGSDAVPGRLSPDDSRQLRALLAELSEKHPHSWARQSAGEILKKLSGSK